MTEQRESTDITIEIRRGSPTEEELAAVVAVVTEAYRTEVDTLEADDDTPTSLWHRSRHGLRAPLRRELGWRGMRGMRG